jgi:hypothetical protein
MIKRYVGTPFAARYAAANRDVFTAMTDSELRNKRVLKTHRGFSADLFALHSLAAVSFVRKKYSEE